MDSPLRVRVTGRPGAGRRTVAQALRGAGIAVADADGGGDVDVYVFVETLTADDRAALAGSVRPTVAVLNKADIEGFGGGGTMAGVVERCRQLRRETGVPVRPLSALLAVAGTDPQIPDGVLGPLRTLAFGACLDRTARQRLAADLDVLGTALAVAALRGGPGPSALPELWRGASGIGEVLAEIDRAGAAIRYRSAVGPARLAAAHSVLGAVDSIGRGPSDHLARAIHWQRYARGPVSPLHRACALDAARGALRLWAQAGGRPAALP